MTYEIFLDRNNEGEKLGQYLFIVYICGIIDGTLKNRATKDTQNAVLQDELTTFEVYFRRSQTSRLRVSGLDLSAPFTSITSQIFLNLLILFFISLSSLYQFS